MDVFLTYSKLTICPRFITLIYFTSRIANKTNFKKCMTIVVENSSDQFIEHVYPKHFLDFGPFAMKWINRATLLAAVRKTITIHLYYLYFRFLGFLLCLNAYDFKENKSQYFF